MQGDDHGWRTRHPCLGFGLGGTDYVCCCQFAGTLVLLECDAGRRVAMWHSACAWRSGRRWLTLMSYVCLCRVDSPSSPRPCSRTTMACATRCPAGTRSRSGTPGTTTRTRTAASTPCTSSAAWASVLPTAASTNCNAYQGGRLGVGGMVLSAALRQDSLL